MIIVIDNEQGSRQNKTPQFTRFWRQPIGLKRIPTNRA